MCCSGLGAAPELGPAVVDDETAASGDGARQRQLVFGKGIRCAMWHRRLARSPAGGRRRTRRGGVLPCASTVVRRRVWSKGIGLDPDPARVGGRTRERRGGVGRLGTRVRFGGGSG